MGTLPNTMPSSRREIFNLPLLALAGGVAAAAGCYGAAPPRPAPVAMPDVAPGSHLSVQSQVSTVYENVQHQSETCPQGVGSGSKECVKTTYTVKEPVSRTKTTAFYGDTQLSYGQFQVLTDPGYDDKLLTLADHSEACQEANVPRYVGMGLMLAGSMAYIFTSGKTRSIGGTVGLAGGAGSYAAGYLAFGGNRCVAAASLYSRINYARHSGTMTINGARTASEMAAVAQEFNMRSSQVQARVEIHD